MKKQLALLFLVNCMLISVVHANSGGEKKIDNLDSSSELIQETATNKTRTYACISCCPFFGVLDEEFLIALTKIAVHNRQFIGKSLNFSDIIYPKNVPYELECRRLADADEYISYPVDNLPHLILKGFNDDKSLLIGQEGCVIRKIFVSFLADVKKILISVHEAAPYRNVIQEQKMLIKAYEDIFDSYYDAVIAYYHLQEEKNSTK